MQRACRYSSDSCDLAYIEAFFRPREQQTQNLPPVCAEQELYELWALCSHLVPIAGGRPRHAYRVQTYGNGVARQARSHARNAPAGVEEAVSHARHARSYASDARAFVRHACSSMRHALEIALLSTEVVTSSPMRRRSKWRIR